MNQQHAVPSQSAGPTQFTAQLTSYSIRSRSPVLPQQRLLLLPLLLFVKVHAAGTESDYSGPDPASSLRKAILASDFAVAREECEMGLHVVNGISSSGVTPLMVAVYKEEEYIVNMLISHGADLDVQDQQGQTALIIAAHKGSTALLATLLEAGAKVGLRTKGSWLQSRETAEDIASREGLLRTWENGYPADSEIALLFKEANSRRVSTDFQHDENQDGARAV